jgi:hypothetical protein
VRALKPLCISPCAFMYYMLRTHMVGPLSRARCPSGHAVWS